MKLSSDEGRAIVFVLGLIALATVARVVTRPGRTAAPAAAGIDAAALEDSSEQALEVSRARAKPLGREERIDVNAASAPELDRLPGVGPGLAARIIEERESGGAYDSAPDLRKVRGIGPALLGKLEPHLAFGFSSRLSRRTPAVGRPEEEIGTAPARTSRRAANALAQEGTAEQLDLNTATAAQFDALPGVGPALAARIVAKRDSINGFANIEDLKKVRGIGSATLDKLRPFFRS